MGYGAKHEFGIKRKHSKCEMMTVERQTKFRIRREAKENCPSANSSRKDDDVSADPARSLDDRYEFIQGRSLDGSLVHFEIGACPVEGETETEGEPELEIRWRSPGCSVYDSESTDEEGKRETGARTMITDIRSASEDEEEVAQSDVSLVSRSVFATNTQDVVTTRSEEYGTGVKNVPPGRIRNYYEDLRMRETMHSNPQGPRRPPGVEERAPAPKSGGRQIVEGNIAEPVLTPLIPMICNPGLARHGAETCQNVNVYRSWPLFAPQIPMMLRCPGRWCPNSAAFCLFGQILRAGRGGAQRRITTLETPNRGLCPNSIFRRFQASRL